MKILLDECVPWPIHKLLVGHECKTAQHCGWRSIKNGELLSLAERDFDLSLTSDQSITYQQNLKGRKIAFLQLSTNKIRPIAAATLLREAVASMKPAEFRATQIS